MNITGGNRKEVLIDPVRVLYSKEEQQLLSKSTLLSIYRGAPKVVAVANEGIRTTIWDSKTGNTLQVLPHGRISDVKGMICNDSLMKTGKRMRTSENGSDFLCTVDSSSIRLYSTNINM